MPGGSIETHLDDTPLATGTHKGSTHATILNDPGADFRSCGVQTDVLIKNTTDGSEGQVESRMEDTVTCDALTGGTNNAWTAGDTYEIYITDTEDSQISSTWTDKRYGRKHDKRLLDHGLIPEDIDADEWESNVFGPGQPENPRGKGK